MRNGRGSSCSSSVLGEFLGDGLDGFTGSGVVDGLGVNADFFLALFQAADGLAHFIGAIEKGLGAFVIGLLGAETLGLFFELFYFAGLLGCVDGLERGFVLGAVTGTFGKVFET
jgi:hypothetical protein